MTNLSVDIGANWGAALTLLERLDIYQATSRPPLPHSALGQARAARWQSTEFPLVHELQACLSADDDQWSLLSAPPPWVTDSRRAWLANSSASDRSVQNGFADSERAFLKVAAPFLQLNETALRAFTDAMLSDDQRDSTVTSKVIDDLMEDLAAETLRLLTPVLALEVNVARLEQRFGAISASDRFLATIEFLSTATGRAQLLNTYPVLARSLTLCGQHWLAASQSFLRRLVNDMPAVREMLSLAGDDQVMSVSRPLGDPHRAGLSVKTVQFSSGAKIVYKPRSLAVDLHFQGLLTWLNAKGAMPPFRTLRVLDRTTHGWAEWIRPQPCSDVEEIRRFYRAAGGLLAVLYAIHGTDAHFENLVASGDTPLLVDLETLFHPMTSGPSDAEEHQPTEVDSPHSVLATGLLPVRRATEDIQADISGLTGAAGTAATPTLRWVELGTDRMRLTQEMAALNSSAHRPMLPDRHVTVVEFTDDVLTGFESTYRLVLTNRAELLAESGPLALFGRDETRVVFRNTRDYVYLLAWSRHPDCLRNALDRDFLFQQLRPEIARRPILSRVIDAECRDLHAGPAAISSRAIASSWQKSWTSRDSTAHAARSLGWVLGTSRANRGCCAHRLPQPRRRRNGRQRRVRRTARVRRWSQSRPCHTRIAWPSPRKSPSGSRHWRWPIPRALSGLASRSRIAGGP
jgi:hypothetical protein